MQILWKNIDFLQNYSSFCNLTILERQSVKRFQLEKGCPLKYIHQTPQIFPKYVIKDMVKNVKKTQERPVDMYG